MPAPGPLGSRGSHDVQWSWEPAPQAAHRRRFYFIQVSLAAQLTLLAAIMLFTSSFGGGAGPPACGGAQLDVSGTLTGAATWCAPEGTVVQEAIGIVSVHYPGGGNPCAFPPERGPSDGWYEVPGDYHFTFDGPTIPGELSSAAWSYAVTGSFGLCGGENSMRVTIVLITNLAGATAWIEDFGPGAFGSRSGSFKPVAPSTPTPTPSASPTPTAPPPPTPAESPSPTPTPALSPSATPSPPPGSPTPPASPTPAPPPGTATSTPTPTPGAPTPTQSPSPAAVSTSTPSAAPTVSPAVAARALPPTGRDGAVGSVEAMALVGVALIVVGTGLAWIQRRP